MQLEPGWPGLAGCAPDRCPGASVCCAQEGAVGREASFWACPPAPLCSSLIPHVSPAKPRQE